MEAKAETRDDGSWLAAEWMITASGQKFYPTAPDPKAVRIADIAHALAHLCRYNGHVMRFFSVAEHSVLLCRHFAMRGQLGLARWALVHDAAEAYLGDVIRPLKRALPDYRRIEHGVERAVFDALGLEGEPPPQIKAADTAILSDERRQLFPPALVGQLGWTDRQGLGITIHGWLPDAARWNFLDCYDRLFGKAAPVSGLPVKAAT